MTSYCALKTLVVPRNAGGMTRRLLLQQTTTRTVASIQQTTKLSAPSPATIIQATNVIIATDQQQQRQEQQESPRIKFSSLATHTEPNSASTNPSADFSTSAAAAAATIDERVLRQQNDDSTDNDQLLDDVDMDGLMELASQKSTPLKLSDMHKYASLGDRAQRLRNAQFLHKEIPIRIAQRAVDLLTLPDGLAQTKPVQQIVHIYLAYLEKFEEFPEPTTYEQEDAFTDMLQTLVLDRTSIPTAIARGVANWREEDSHKEYDATRMQEMEDALYRFFTARVGLRFLTEHHVLSSPRYCQQQDHHYLLTGRPNNEPQQEQEQSSLGCIQTNCDPHVVVQRVAQEVMTQTKELYGTCPEIEIVNSSSSDTEFTYAPHHLEYMLSELLKNSCRATVRRYLGTQLQRPEDEEEASPPDENALPPIRVVVVKGAEDVTIKVADRGGGVPRSTMQQIWTFSHSTADVEEHETDFGTNAFTGSGQTKGFGLPLARIYARYFGGELTLKSMEGYGVDAYLYLPRLGEACENLPKKVTASPGNRDSMPQKRVLGIRRYSTSSTTVAAPSDGSPLLGVLDMLRRRAL